MSETRKTPLATLIAYEGANRGDFVYVESVIKKITNSKIDSWDEKEQLTILNLLNRKEILSLIKMCKQIIEEPWDEFSTISGYSLDELEELRLFLSSYEKSLDTK